MGILTFVLRGAHGDTTNNGVSNQYDQFVVTNLEGPFAKSDTAAELRLEVDSRGNPKLIPTSIPEGKWVMFGGNYAGTSDSRWGQALRKLLGYDPRVVPIFDRVEYMRG